MDRTISDAIALALWETNYKMVDHDGEFGVKFSTVQDVFEIGVLIGGSVEDTFEEVIQSMRIRASYMYFEGLPLPTCLAVEDWDKQPLHYR